MVEGSEKHKQTKIGIYSQQRWEETYWSAFIVKAFTMQQGSVIG